MRVRPILASIFVPYAVLALPFYACWSHPDPRYLAGVSLVLIGLVASGAAIVCRLAADPATSARLRAGVAAAALAIATVALCASGPRGPLVPGPPEAALAAAIAVAALASFVRAPIGGLTGAALAPGLALALAGLLRLAHGEGGRDPFQRAQVERARGAVEAVVPGGALVLVGDRLGRPAENIAHYTHADAHYLDELPLLSTDPVQAAARYALVSRRSFLLIAADESRELDALAPAASLRVVERRSGEALYDWFVDPNAARRGAVLYEIAVSEAALAAARAARPPPQYLTEHP